MNITIGSTLKNVIKEHWWDCNLMLIWSQLETAGELLPDSNWAVAKGSFYKNSIYYQQSVVKSVVKSLQSLDITGLLELVPSSADIKYHVLSKGITWYFFVVNPRNSEHSILSSCVIKRHNLLWSIVVNCGQRCGQAVVISLNSISLLPCLMLCEDFACGSL